jgi:acylphosphatase
MVHVRNLPGQMVDKAVKVIIRGRVQGVGYRDWAERQAQSLGLSGYVRNRRDGSVELVVAGSADRIELMLNLCRQGPRLAQVQDVETADCSWTGNRFEILPTA